MLFTSSKKKKKTNASCKLSVCHVSWRVLRNYILKNSPSCCSTPCWWSRGRERKRHIKPTSFTQIRFFFFLILPDVYHTMCVKQFSVHSPSPADHRCITLKILIFICSLPLPFFFFCGVLFLIVPIKFTDVRFWSFNIPALFLFFFFSKASCFHSHCHLRLKWLGRSMDTLRFPIVTVCMCVFFFSFALFCFVSDLH